MLGGGQDADNATVGVVLVGVTTSSTSLYIYRFT